MVYLMPTIKLIIVANIPIISKIDFVISIQTQIQMLSWALDGFDWFLLKA